jgi:hypothetical protein
MFWIFCLVAAFSSWGTLVLLARGIYPPAAKSINNVYNCEASGGGATININRKKTK